MLGRVWNADVGYNSEESEVKTGGIVGREDRVVKGRMGCWEVQVRQAREAGLKR